MRGDTRGAACIIVFAVIVRFEQPPKGERYPPEGCDLDTCNFIFIIIFYRPVTSRSQMAEM